MIDFLQSALIGGIAGVFSAGTVWGMLRTELKYLRRDVDHAHKRLDRLTEGVQHGN